MATRKTSQSEHDQVVQVSSTTYSELQKQGYEVAINPGSEKNRWVGGEENKLYPDVIIWKPNSPGSTSGTAIIIEEIETSESVNGSEALQWKKFGELGITMFRLIVPLTHAAKAHQLVLEKDAKVKEIWYYEKRDNTFAFHKYVSLA